MDNSYFSNSKHIDDKTIGKLEELAEQMLFIQDNYEISFDFIEKALLMYITNAKHTELSDNISKVKIIKKWEVISTALDFYKSIDNKMYEKVRDVIFNQDKKTRFNIYRLSDIKNFDEMDFEFNKFSRYSYSAINHVLDNKDFIYVPIKCGWEYNEKLSEQLGKDNATIEDLYTIVHELAHTFDVYLDCVINADKRIISDIYDYNFFLTESNAIAFEELLTDFLLKTGKINNEKEVEERFVNRKKYTIHKAYLTYARLVLARKLKENECIKKEDIEEILWTLKIKDYLKEVFIYELIYLRNENFIIDVGYAISGVFSPTIEKVLNNGELEKYRKFLDASRRGDFSRAINILGIEEDEKGIEVLEKNLGIKTKQIEDNIEER